MDDLIEIAPSRPLEAVIQPPGSKSITNRALICAALAGCTGEQFQKGYILPPNALEQIPIGASQDHL